MKLFTSLKPVGFNVSLLNHTRLSIKFVGIVQIFFDLLLEDVLLIPEFQFNLILVSVLTMKLPYKVQFDDDFCLIQNKSSLRTINKAKLQ